MAVRIKTISNNISGPEKSPANNGHTHKVSKAPAESGQSNKILELEWEALGRKLHKQMDKTPNTEVEKMRRQLKEKDEQLKQAEWKISELRKQLTALQEKQRAQNLQAANNGGQRKKPAARPARAEKGQQRTDVHRR